STVDRFPRASNATSTPLPPVISRTAPTASPVDGVNRGGGTESTRQLQLVVGEIEGHHLACPEGAHDLHEVQTDPSPSDDRDGVARGHACDVAHRTDTGEHAAAEDAGLLEVDARREREHVRGGHHAVPAGAARHDEAARDVLTR